MPNGRTCHRENTQMPPQLTFWKTRDEAQKSEQHQPQGAVKKLAVIFSQFAVNANNDGEKEVLAGQRVGGSRHIDNCLSGSLVSLVYLTVERSPLVSLSPVITQ